MSEKTGALLGARRAPLQEPEERAHYAVDGWEPRYIAKPATVQEAAEVLRQAADDGLAVIPRGGGTKMGLGNVPRGADVILSTRGMDGILDYTPADLTITVAAGMRLGALQEVLRRERQFLALDPPVAAEATVGGVVAANASGPRRLRYGSARDLVIGVRVAQASGVVTKAGAKVVKNVAGYDLNKLYVGSLGTLVVLGEISFKLTPLPELYRSIVCPMPNVAAAMATVDRMLHSPLMPTALDLVSGHAKQGLRSLAHYDSPGDDGVLLVAEVDGFAQGVARSLRDIEGYARTAGASDAVTLSDEAAREVWDDLRESPHRLGTTITLKMSVPVAAVAHLMDATARTSLGKQKVGIVAHAGSGIVYVHADGEDQDVAGMAREIARLRGLAVQAGGSLVVEQCPTTLKSEIDVWGEVGTALAIMKALKATYDPGNILNPGRFVGGI